MIVTSYSAHRVYSIERNKKMWWKEISMLLMLNMEFISLVSAIWNICINNVVSVNSKAIIVFYMFHRHFNVVIF